MPTESSSQNQTFSKINHIITEKRYVYVFVVDYVQWIQNTFLMIVCNGPFIWPDAAEENIVRCPATLQQKRKIYALS